MKTLKILIALLFICFFSQAQIVKPVKWSYASKKLNKTEAILYLKAEIQNPWHIYSVNLKEGGPTKTSFVFTKSKDFSLIGKVTEPKPIQKHEEVFEMDVFYFEKAVIFEQRIKLLTPQTIVKGSIEFMACTNEQCLPPDMIEFAIPVK